MLTLRDLAQVFFRFKIYALAVLVGALVLVVGLSLFMTPIFQSTAVVLVKFGREYVYRPETGAANSQLIAPLIDRDEVLNEQVQILKSRDIVTETIHSIGLLRLYPQLRNKEPVQSESAAVRHFEQALTIVPVRNSSTIRVSFEHPDPALARETLDRFLDTFRVTSIRVFSTLQTGFFENQERTTRQRLAFAESELSQFRNGEGVDAYDEQRGFLLRQVADLDTVASQTDARLSEIRRNLDVLGSQMKTVPRELESYRESEQSRFADDARGKLLNLRLREQDLLTRFQPGSEQAQQARREIEIAERALKGQEASFSGRVRQGLNETWVGLERDQLRLQGEQAALTDRRAELVRQRIALETRLRAVSGNTARLHELERNVAATETALRSILARLEEARIYDALNQEKIGSVSIVQQAVQPDPKRPVRPEPFLYLAAGLMAALVGAVIVVGIAELMSDTVALPDRAANYLELPVLAAFPLVAGMMPEPEPITATGWRGTLERWRRRLQR